MSILAKWNPLDKSASVVLSNNDLTATCSLSAWNSVRSTLPISSGKIYIEMTYSSGTYVMIGFADADAPLGTTGFWADTAGYGYHSSTGNKFNNGANVAYGSSYSTGNVIGIALDMDAGKIWWSKNGVWQTSGDPAAGTSPAYTGLTGNLYAVAGLYASSLVANFGQSAFAYTVPSGFTGGLSVQSYAVNGIVKAGGSLYPGAKVLLIDRVTQSLVSVATAAETTAEYSFTGLLNENAGRYATHIIDPTDTYNDVASSAITAVEET